MAASAATLDQAAVQLSSTRTALAVVARAQGRAR